MTFINWPILLALSGVAVPILIHLFNRRQATPMDWGAMNFLLASITSRKKRILIEEILLMVMRCMLVALLVLTIARPFLPSNTAIPWMIVLPTLLAASVCAAVGSAMWSQKRARMLLLSAAGLLLLIAGGASAMEYWSQTQRWSGSGSKDVVVIIDASASMTLQTDDKTNFQHALDEAAELIKARRRGDAFSIILAGAGPDAIVPSPISDGAELQAALDSAEPMGASMNLSKAIAQATACLERGHGASKAIVILTDGQKLGWNVGGAGQWDLAAAGFKRLPSTPLILCRDLPLPSAIDNASIGEITFSRGVIGTDRAVGINVKIFNAGKVQIPAASVELQIDGVIVGSEPAEDIPPQAARTVYFTHLFKKSGPHVAMARVLRKDDIPGDNISHRIIKVTRKLPVLIVNGNPDGLDADMLKLALTPQEGTDQKYLVEPTVVPVAKVVGQGDFGRYRVVALADVPRLPESVTKSLEKFVTEGGGLLIAPGRRAIADFYNQWTDVRHRNFIPAKLITRRVNPDKPAKAALNTFRHPALTVAGDMAYSDMDKAAISAWWKLMARAGGDTGGNFNTSEPILVERQTGKGRVIILATSLGAEDSNLPRLECYVLLMHELAYYLAAGAGHPHAGAQAGATVVTELTASDASKLAAAQGETVSVTAPDGATLEAKTKINNRSLQLRFDDTHRPGLYSFQLPPSLAEPLKASTTDGKTVPFAVYGDPAEGLIETLAGDDFAMLASQMNVFHARTFSELASAVRGQIPGEELWKYLALGLLALIMGEIALTRWISSQRSAGATEGIPFVQEGGERQTMKQRARDALTSTDT
ncbi:MAG: VWA domain-containing protein [Phycisphaerae bacterium]|nr:VWA domain-containing protein [Phycisphaerae bacterium]